ncbi:PQQ-dependent sugar dehydrogenase, partial [Kocuria oceani]
GCRLRFAPDGTLRVGTGDAAQGENPQDLGSLGGKTLRLHPDGTVPDDNPFADRPGSAAAVYTLGHRNVHKTRRV